MPGAGLVECRYWRIEASLELEGMYFMTTEVPNREACCMVGFSCMYLISPGSRSDSVLGSLYLVQWHQTILVFIVQLQYYPIHSECIDDGTILKDVLTAGQAIVGIVPLAPLAPLTVSGSLRWPTPVFASVIMRPF